MPSMVFFQPSHGVIARISSTPPPSPSPSTSLTPSFRFPRPDVFQWPSNSFAFQPLGEANLLLPQDMDLVCLLCLLFSGMNDSSRWLPALPLPLSPSNFHPVTRARPETRHRFSKIWVFPELSQRPRSSEPISGFSEYLRLSILTHLDSYQHIFSRNTILPNCILS